jgi:hypothetical protein
MKIKITTIGTLNNILLNNKEIIQGKEFTIQEVLRVLVKKYGKPLAKELYKEGKINTNLSILLNGRNILSMPYKFETGLKDEIIIAEQITGG